MNREIVFLLEEPSMNALLEVLLPRLVPQATCVLVPHEGKRDLCKSIPRKLKAWRTPGAKFIVVHDQDSADCRKLKQEILALVPHARRHDTIIRIACHELESWILGDLHAVARAFDKPTIANLGVQQKFRDPDALGNPAEELFKLVPGYQKVSGARRVAEFFDSGQNTSQSFAAFLEAVVRLSAENAEV